MADESKIVADLRAQLDRAEQGQQAAEQGQQAAEQGLQAEKKRRLAAEQEQQAEKERRLAAEASLDESTRRTTFPEYLKLVHERYALQIRYEPKNLRNTSGGVTNPRDRTTPTVIAPWDGFDEEQAATYQELCEAFQDKRLFPNESAVSGSQITINDFLITSEKDLVTFTNVAQTAPAREIVNHLINLGGVTNGRPGLKVRFSPRGDPDEDTKAAFAPVDGVWDYDGPRTLEELKPPHKLPEESLQEALDDGTGHPRRIIETEVIINQSHAKKDSSYIVTAVFTQVFDYMVESGTTLAYLNTGMAYVFFKINELEPTRLCYKLVIPPRTSTAYPVDTSVCQLAMFIRRCLCNPKRDASWIRNAIESNGRFLVDPEAQLNLMSSPLSSASEVVTPGKEDYKPPKLKRRRQSTPEAGRQFGQSRDSPGSDDEGDSSPIQHRHKTRSGVRERSSRRAADTSTTSTSGGAGSSASTGGASKSRCTFCAPRDAARRYCSQACLRGLMLSFWTKIPRELDLTCPNARRHSQSSKHHLSYDEFQNLLRQQFVRSHTHAIENLERRGSSGHWFAITLCSHAYTFVGKGSRSDQVPALAHEAEIYKIVQPLQGHCIPICLGLLELEGPYYLPAPNHLTHFLLLSYGGSLLFCERELLPPTKEVILSIKTALGNLHKFGILHRDVRAENFLWNKELQCAMIIDFGESTVVDLPNGIAPSRHHLLSAQQRNRGIVSASLRFKSSAGVRKNRKTGFRHTKLTTLSEARQQELDEVEREVLRWLPAS